MPPPLEPQDLKPGTVFGDYVVWEPIGKGGFALVFRAQQRSLGRDVALKALTASSSIARDARRRFIQEARLAARVSHPRVVRVFDAGEVEGLLFIAWELIEGSTLRVSLRRQRRFPPAEAIAVAIACAQGLEAIHAAGILHRDLKPENVFVCSRRGVLIGDFGCSRDELASLAQTSPGSLPGTAQYMSPEVARGQQAGPQSDVYSLGVMLHEMLTGSRPFPGDTRAELLHQRAVSPIPIPSESVPGISPQLDALVVRALANTPSERLSGAREFLDTLVCLPGQLDQSTSCVSGPASHPPEHAAGPAVVQSGPVASRPPAPGGSRPGWGLSGGAVLLALLLLVWGEKGPESPGNTASGPALASQGKPPPAPPGSARARLGLQAEETLASLERMAFDARTGLRRAENAADSESLLRALLDGWRRACGALSQSLREAERGATQPPGPADPELMLARAFLVARRCGSSLRDVTKKEWAAIERREGWVPESTARSALMRDRWRRESGELVLQLIASLSEQSLASRDTYLRAGLACMETLTRYREGARSRPRRFFTPAAIRGLWTTLTRSRDGGARDVFAVRAVLEAFREAGESMTSLTLVLEAAASFQTPRDGRRDVDSLRHEVMYAVLESARIDLVEEHPGEATPGSRRRRAKQDWTALAERLTRTLPRMTANHADLAERRSEPNFSLLTLEGHEMLQRSLASSLDSKTEPPPGSRR